MDTDIPHRLHFYWDGPNRPEWIIQAWRDLHPGFEVTVWNEAKIRFTLGQTFAHAEWFYRTPRLNQKSDLARLAVLYAFGGVYIDADVVPMRRLPEEWFHHTAELGLVQEKKGLISNSVIAAPAGSALLREWQAQLHPERTNQPVWKTTGPRVLTDWLRTRGWVSTHDMLALSPVPGSPLRIHPYFTINLGLDLDPTFVWRHDPSGLFSPRRRNRDVDWVRRRRPWAKEQVVGFQCFLGGKKKYYSRFAKLGWEAARKRIDEYLDFVISCAPRALRPAGCC